MYCPGVAAWVAGSRSRPVIGGARRNLLAGPVDMAAVSPARLRLAPGSRESASFTANARGDRRVATPYW
jgi:hypothetical protein